MSIKKYTFFAMIDNNAEDPYKNITGISLIDAKKVFYPLRYALQKREINFDDQHSLYIKVFAEDISYPSTITTTDAGQLLDYSVSFDINNQAAATEQQLLEFINRKVIVVLHYTYGRIILGCNDMPLIFSFNENNTTSPAGTSGYAVECNGKAYTPKVMR